MCVNIKDELNKMNIYDFTYEVLQEKDTIQVSRIFCENESYVLKLFQSEKYVKEILYYDVLQNLSIPTLKVISKTEQSILLEDIENSEYRLCTIEDYKNPQYVKKIAKWFKVLHTNGKNADFSLFDNDLADFTKENLIFYKNALSINNPTIDFYINNYNSIMQVIKAFPITILRNDCGYNNSVIKKDSSMALMFDYNYTICGNAYSEIREFLLNFDDDMKDLFLFEYGEINEQEKKVYDVLYVLLRLFMHYENEGFSADVEWCLNELKSEEYYLNLINIFS